jgi:hypothetical protein
MAEKPGRVTRKLRAVRNPRHSAAAPFIGVMAQRSGPTGGAAERAAETLDQLQPAVAVDVQPFENWRQFRRDCAALVLTAFARFRTW